MDDLFVTILNTIGLSAVLVAGFKLSNSEGFSKWKWSTVAIMLVLGLFGLLLSMTS